MNKNKSCTTEKNKNKEFVFTVSFNKDGDSFQNIMEKILISKLSKK